MKWNTSTVSSALSTKRSRIAASLREGHREAAKDVRSRGGRCGLCILFAIWLLTLLAIIVIFAILGALGDGLYWVLEDRGAACMPDGKFSVDPSSFPWFSSAGLFQITMGFGNLSFTQVKAIDICWDIVVGRGGQALLAYISWHVFANYVTTSMEVTPVTFRTYRTIFLPGSSLLKDIFRMIGDFATRHGLHSKIAMGFMIFTMVLTLVFPTMAGAMTGYNGNVQAFVRTTDDNYVPFEKFTFALFVVHDGERVGLDKDYVVKDYKPTGQAVLDAGEWEAVESYKGCSNVLPMEGVYTADDCDVTVNVVSYVEKYGFAGEYLQTKNTIFKHDSLPSPVLNISAFHLPADLREMVESSSGGILYPSHTSLSDKSRMTWYYANRTYDLADIKQRGKCQPALDYQWGFSFLQLLIMVIVLLVWTMGIWVLWLRSRSVMKKRGRTEMAGEYKAVFELADTMRTQIQAYEKEHGDDVPAVTEANLRRRVMTDLRGGSMSYLTPLLPNGKDGQGDAGWSFTTWVSQKGMSIFALIVCFGLASFGYITVLAAPLPLECGICLYIGTSRRSRIILFFWIYVVISVVPQIVLSAALHRFMLV